MPLEIGSQHLVETLGRYGIVPRKTYLMKHLPEVPSLFMRHLVRGYVDADGYLLLRPKYGATFGVVSFNREIVEEIQNWLVEELGIRRTAIIHSGVAWHLSKTIIEQHDGRVGVQSAPGVGSTFWFTLPLALVGPK